MHAAEIWSSKAVLPRLIRIALFPLSLLYALGWEGYLFTYRLRLKKPYRSKLPILCIGNLVVGGSGKSPMVVWLVEQLRGLGYQVVVGCSGYGGPHAEAAEIAPVGPLEPSVWGDEPAMIRSMYADLDIVVGRRRVLAAQLVEERFPDAILLMDDGFQHLPLAKDISILLDASEQGNHLCLPAGPYREPRWNLGRANFVLPSKYRVQRLPIDLGVEIPAQANLLCAIGQPQRFEADVAALGVNILERRFLADHDPLTAGTLFDGLDPNVPLIVTAKDWVKLQSRLDLAEREIIVARQRISVEPKDEFLTDLKRKIDEVVEAKRHR